MVSGEIGDTWIHGTGTDPGKVSQYRELLRLRRSWLAEGRLTIDSPVYRDFSRALLQVPEHTWGMDEKTHLADYVTYPAADFQAARSRANFRAFEASWDEQRGYVRRAVEALGEEGLGQEARAALRAIQPARQQTWDWTQAS